MSSEAALASALNDEDSLYRQASVARIMALGQAKLPTLALLEEPLARVGVVVAHHWPAATDHIDYAAGPRARPDR